MIALAFALLVVGLSTLQPDFPKLRGIPAVALGTLAYYVLRLEYPSEIAVPVWVAILGLAGVSAATLPVLREFVRNVSSSGKRSPAASARPTPAARARTSVFKHLLFLLGISVVTITLLILGILLTPSQVAMSIELASFLAPVLWIAICIVVYSMSNGHRASRVVIACVIVSVAAVGLVQTF